MAWEDYEANAPGESGGALEDHFRYLIYHTPLVSLVERAHRTMLEVTFGDTSTASFLASLERMVAPSLKHNRHLGNIYSGSIFASLAGLLEVSEEVDVGARVGVFSYGSGACSEFFSGRLQVGAREAMRARNIRAHLDERRDISLAEYEAATIAQQHNSEIETLSPLPTEDDEHFTQHYKGRDRLVLSEVKNYHRQYTFV
jgi:3-hydroxy-3-methylglutaryl CoA synthase